MTTPILFLTNRLAPAGAETFLLHRVSRLDRSRWRPIVAELREGGALKPRFEALGIQTITLGAARQLDVSSLVRLYTLCRREGVQILEAHVWYACLVARLVGRMARVPIVITNEQDVRAGANTVRRDLLWLGDATTALSTACIHITRASLSSFVDGTPRWLEGGTERRVIPNGIDVEMVAQRAAATDRAAKRRELGLPADAFVIGNVARLQPAKGHVHLLRAFARVRAAVPDAHLVVVGWGVLEEALRAQARELGIADAVHFLGKRLDVYELLPTFDVFAMSSIHEGQGIVVLEAMAAGVPIAAAAADGIPEMVRHEETGLLAPPADPEALAEAILRLRSDPALAARVRARAAEVVRAEYSVEGAAAAYERLYEDLLAQS